MSQNHSTEDTLQMEDSNTIYPDIDSTNPSKWDGSGNTTVWNLRGGSLVTLVLLRPRTGYIVCPSLHHVCMGTQRQQKGIG